MRMRLRPNRPVRTMSKTIMRMPIEQLVRTLRPTMRMRKQMPRPDPEQLHRAQPQLRPQSWMRMRMLRWPQ